MNFGQAVPGGVEDSERAVPGTGHGARLGDHVSQEDVQLEVALDEPGGLQDAPQNGVVDEAVQAHGTGLTSCSDSLISMRSRAATSSGRAKR